MSYYKSRQKQICKRHCTKYSACKSNGTFVLDVLECFKQKDGSKIIGVRKAFKVTEPITK